MSKGDEYHLTVTVMDVTVMSPPKGKAASRTEKVKQQLEENIQIYP